MSNVPQPLRRRAGVRVLVAHAGVHGSTRSIAERIAACLEEQGAQVDVLPVEAVSDPSEYDAYVVGSAIHDMAWLPEALSFVRASADLLARRDVWLFSVEMPAAMRGPWRALVAKEEGHVVGGLIDELRPRGHGLFSGVIDPEHLTRRGRVKFQAMGLRYGDYRDWPAVDTWARRIGREVLGHGGEAYDVPD
ncbi:flavodoxin domain-containing protein [Streptomyces sp. NPDC058326]|uniref:flavodoxin domain-containing protein n=1 Tax=Streptomyces sp. NPDC058326 TaxID=3346447 RepID=UPI0036E79D62